jgi:hypothetical protein
MKYLHNFDSYNEEIKISLNDRGLPKLTGTGKALRNLAVGGAIAGGLSYGANSMYQSIPDKPVVKYEQTVMGSFKEYELRTPGSDYNIQFTINTKDSIIGSRIKVGKHDRYTLTVTSNVTKVCYDLSTWGGYIYGSSNSSDLQDPSDVIDLNELEVVEEGSTYKILRVSSFWSNLDYIFVDKGFESTMGEFEIDGETYTYIEKSFGFLEGRASFVIKK